jgi:hypothetical protein
MTKTSEQVHDEITALKNLAISVPDDAIAQASIAGQINALEWAVSFQAAE